VLEEAEVEGFGFFAADVDAVLKPGPAPQSPRRAAVKRAEIPELGNLAFLVVVRSDRTLEEDGSCFAVRTPPLLKRL
jgi:hypothetical protein